VEDNIIIKTRKMFNSDYFSVVSEAGNAQVTVVDKKQPIKIIMFQNKSTQI